MAHPKEHLLTAVGLAANDSGCVAAELGNDRVMDVQL
jgi:hypothetical protein